MEPLDIEALKEKAEPAHQVDSDPKGDTVKTRITFEVDTNELFDTLQKMNGNTAPIGERIVGVMLADDGFFNKVGMAVYGVTVIDRKPADAAPASASALSELSRLRSENEGMRKANEWQPIDTCPIGKSVDLWCVYGGEEFAQFEGGASIGQLVSNRHKTEKYGFFGNQSNDGVPRRDGPDLKPVAWRPAVPMCPPEIIATAMNVPATYAEAVDRAALSSLKEEDAR